MSVHYELIPQIQTVNQVHYVRILKLSHEAVHRKRPKLWPNDCILHHDNATAYKGLSVNQFLAQKSITEQEYPPYSPDWLRMTCGCYQKQSLP